MNPFRKELYVAIHAQSARFRLVKYAILVPLFAAIYRFWGGRAFLWTLGIALVFAIALHLFYRWKTDAWTKDWGGYKSVFK